MTDLKLSLAETIIAYLEGRSTFSELLQTSQNISKLVEIKKENDVLLALQSLTELVAQLRETKTASISDLINNTLDDILQKLLVYEPTESTEDQSLTNEVERNN